MSESRFRILHLVLFFVGAVLWAGFNADVASDEINRFYKVSSVEAPGGLSNQVGGMDFTPDGRLAACFHRGEVYMIQPETEEWSLFAYGLQEPLGLEAVSNNELLVMQRGELTRLRDTDGDGRADHYQTVSDDWGLSGNYCEYGFGPAIGPEGNAYVSLNTASNGAGISDETRGEFNKLGRPGRMYSCVPYRGWVMKIDPETGETEPFASGFRSPDGINFDQQGRLLVTDNQGDWRGTSPMHSVEKGGFYGHVSSLIWREGWDRGNPLKLPLRELHEMRSRPVIEFPHGRMANSPTQPLPITEQADMPFQGQLLVGEMNRSRIMRVMLENVGGQTQGAVVPFYDGAGLDGGNHRMTWGPQGHLWVGHTHLEWAGGEGVQKISWNNETPMEVQDMSLTEYGFDLTFTRPVKRAKAGKPENYSFQRFYYRYHRPYGSDEHDVTEVPVRDVQISEGGRRVSLQLGQMIPGYVYELRINGVKSQKGDSLLNSYLVYTMNSLRKGRTFSPQFAEAPKPEFDPGAGMLMSEQAVRISAPEGEEIPDGCQLVYNVNGLPLIHSSKPYRKPVHIDENTTLKAAFVKDGELVSQVRIVNYEFVSGEDLVAISNMKVNSERSYKLQYRKLKKGLPPFTDRNYSYTKVPEVLKGATHIAVPQEDVGSKKNPLLRFDINKKADVYIAWDTRWVDKLPDWMKSFEKLDLTMDDSSGTPGYRLFRKTYPAGTVILGPMGRDTKAAMYHIAIKQAK